MSIQNELMIEVGTKNLVMCDVCNGCGEVMREDEYDTCPCCNGSGKLYSQFYMMKE